MAVYAEVVPWPVKNMTNIGGNNYRYECPECDRVFLANIERPNGENRSGPREVNGTMRMVYGKPGHIVGFCPDCNRALDIPNPHGGRVSSELSLVWTIRRPRANKR